MNSGGIMKIKVGVIFGGNTVEHEVSIISAVQAMRHINKDKYEVVPIYITKDLTWYTGPMLMDIANYKDISLIERYAKKIVLIKQDNAFYLKNTKGLFNRYLKEIDIAFPIVHGNNIEDGTIQGYLNLLGIPFVGSHVLGSALGQDKVVLKQILSSNNLPIVDYTWFYDNEYLENKEEIIKKVTKLGLPVIVKPATLGSSVGISVVKKLEDLEESINDAIKYDNKIVVEKLVANLTEVNCSVLGNYEHSETSLLEEVLSEEEFLTYKDKYLSKGKSKGMASTNRILPARLDKKVEEEIYSLSKEVFRALNLSGVCRIDYLIDKKTNKVYINEPNTIPGSLSFYLWEAKGKKYEELLDDMLTLAIKNYKNSFTKIKSFESNILSNYNGIKGSKGKLQ
jgi:D-alanine-D-alanine ligase